MSDVADVMSPVVQRVRAWFAPVDRVERMATIFDPAQSAVQPGGVGALPAPWLDLGWIAGFTRHCGTKVTPLRSGTPTVAQMQARTEVEATVSFSFDSWGKLQLALAAGTQQMNLLKTAAGAAAQGSGGVALAATSLLSGSTSTLLQVGAAAAQFSVGGLVVVDADYAGQTGFVGSGVSGAYVKTALTDVDYIRRVSLNVARIASIGNGALTLQTPLLAGAPNSAMKVSAVAGLCDREGSSFFQEWSAVFVGEGQQGGRVFWHYPRLQTMEGIAEAGVPAPGGYEKLRLAAAFRALPVKDSVDGETVVCFRSYVAA